MLNKLLSWPILPVLYLQGKKLQHSIPEFAEPVGKRVGISGHGPKLSLLIIGDSAAAGVGVDNQQDSLLGKLVDILKAHYQVHWYLHAKSGATTQQTLNSLDRIDSNHFDVIITSIGLNDMTHRVPKDRWLESMAELKKQLTDRFNPSIIITSGLPPIGKFPLIPFPLSWYLGAKEQAFNLALMQQAKIDNRVQFLPLVFTSNTQQKIPTDHLARDGFHPSHRAYELWAEQLYLLIKKNSAKLERNTKGTKKVIIVAG